MVAIDYLFKEKIVKSQKELCKKIGITAPTLSRIKGGDTEVSDDTIRKLNEAFDYRFNMAYFRGESTFFLLEDVVNEKLNADAPKSIDQSSLVNAALAGRDGHIKQLKEQIEGLRADKDALIDSLRQQLADKDEIIKAKDELIAQLRSNIHPITNYDYNIPVAAEEK